MEHSLPRFIVIKIVGHPGHCIYHEDPSKESRPRVLCGNESVLSPFAKIAVEPSKKDKMFVHLRFSHSNKYWARDADTDKPHIVAISDQQEEDTSKPSCTLFAVHFHSEDAFNLKHVQSRSSLSLDPDYNTMNTSPLFVDDDHYYDLADLTFVNCDYLVKLPKNVAFKGNNGKYLSSDGQRLQFSSEDNNERVTAYEVHSTADGHVQIKSVCFDKFWRRRPGWPFVELIYCKDIIDDKETLFWPVKIDANTIALQSATGNNYFCNLTEEGGTDHLTAEVSNITREARLQVEELVIQTRIYNVRYRTEDAHILHETPYLAGTTTAVNRSDKDDTVSVKIAHVDTRSHTFSKGVSLTVGFKTTIEADLLCFVKDKIEISSQISGSLTWGDTTTETTTVEATATVKLAPSSKAVVRYVGTKGTLTIPFSYTQEDQRSSDGRFLSVEQIDGVYTAVNCYDFNFEILDTPL